MVSVWAGWTSVALGCRLVWLVLFLTVFSLEHREVFRENRSGIASTPTKVAIAVMVVVRNRFLLESLILAQDERWRRASHMQVERKGPLAGTRVANG